jgi:hypothetical protein
MPARKVSRLPVNRIQLSLHIRHPSLQPAEISTEMRWLPVESFAVGEPCQASGGSGSELAPRLHTESYWVATLDAAFLGRHGATRASASARRNPRGADVTVRASPEFPEAFITLACSSLLRHASFFERIRTGGGSAKLVVTMVESTLTVRPEISRRLADLGLTLEAEFISR